MLGSTHFVAGAAIGKLSGNPLLAAILGFAFHFLMDMVPHWDYGYHFRRNLKSFLIAILDPLIGVISVALFVFYFSDWSYQSLVNMFIGGAFCLLPDVMGVGIKFFKIEKLAFFNKFHHRVHWFLPQDIGVFSWRDISITWRLAILRTLYQVPFWIVSFWILAV